MDLVDWLREKVNDGKGNEFVVDNPASEDSSDWSLYSFTRRQLVRAAVVRDVLKALQADDKAARASEG